LLARGHSNLIWSCDGHASTSFTFEKYFLYRGDVFPTDLASSKDLPEYCYYYKDSDSKPKNENVSPPLVLDLVYELGY